MTRKPTNCRIIAEVLAMHVIDISACYNVNAPALLPRHVLMKFPWSLQKLRCSSQVNIRIQQCIATYRVPPRQDKFSYRLFHLGLCIMLVRFFPRIYDWSFQLLNNVRCLICHVFLPTSTRFWCRLLC